MLPTTLPALRALTDTLDSLMIGALVRSSPPEIQYVLLHLANPYLVCFSQDSAFEELFNRSFA